MRRGNNAIQKRGGGGSGSASGKTTKGAGAAGRNTVGGKRGLGAKR